MDERYIIVNDEGKRYDEGEPMTFEEADKMCDDVVFGQMCGDNWCGLHVVPFKENK